MKLREWATPLTIGVFALMSVTGLLMFFHLDSGLNKVAHEWLGWAMVAGVAAHAVANWQAFKRHFLSSAVGRGVIGVSLLALACSFLPLSGGKGGASPPVMALRGVTKAPIASVAALAGRPVAQIREDLAKAGIALPSAEASLDSVIAENRELQARAMTVIFGRN